MDYLLTYMRKKNEIHHYRRKTGAKRNFHSRKYWHNSFSRV